MKSIQLQWCDLVPHIHLQEYVRVDGLDGEGETFWLIFLPTPLHNIHLVAYSYAGVTARAAAGSLGVVSLKPGTWAQLTFERPTHAPVRVTAGLLSGEPEWGSFPRQAVALGHVVDYVRGNSLRVLTRGQELESRFVKQWDIPVGYALASGRAGAAGRSERADLAQRATQAEQAKLSRMSEMAASAVEAQVARAHELADGVGVAGSEATGPGLLAPFRLGKVHVLEPGGETAIEFRVDHPVCIRVLSPAGEAAHAGQGERTLQHLRRESVMHMRVRAAEPAVGQSRPRLLAVYQNPITKESCAEDLDERNVIGVAALEDGRMVDAVKVSEAGPGAPDGTRVVRVANLGCGEGLRVAVWTADPLTPALSVGGQVGAGRYKLVRFIGAGGMGIVWLARDVRLGEEVALKFLPPEIRTDPVALDDLRRETLRCHRLSHPHIVRIHDLVEAPGEAAFVSMEYVEGPTLSQLRLAQPHGVLGWERLAPMLGELGAALAYAHKENVIHRDLKPANIMLDPRQRVKLTDFGIAVSLSESVSQATAGRRIRGTPAYMSPQQIEGRPPGPPDDIYSLGATLYELLTSRPPFFSGDLLYQALAVTPSPLDARLAELGLKNPVPPQVAATILACLAKEPGQRPPTLKDALAGMGLRLEEVPAPEAKAASLPQAVALQEAKSEPPVAGAGRQAGLLGWARRALGREPRR